MSSRNASQNSIGLFVALSTVIAAVLSIVSVPENLLRFWPDWICLVLIYWALRAPQKIGPWHGFFIGILLEVLFVRVFGVMALGLALLVFISNILHLQMRSLSLIPQMIFVAILIGIYKLITGWLYGLTSDFYISIDYWYSILGDVLVWPFVFILLQQLRHSKRTS